MEHFGQDVETIADRLCDFYAEVRTGDPDELRTRLRQRLAQDARRPGFRAVVDISLDEIYGFATGWTTAAPFPYGTVTERLGAERVERLLVGAVEVDEVAVRYRESDTGRQLVTALTGGDPAWLRTSAEAADEIAFYRQLGWREPEPVPGLGTDVVVFLSPSPDDLLHALPMRDITAQSQGFRGVHCGGRARTTVDLEPATNGQPLEIVDATDPAARSWWDEEVVPMCLESLADGITEGLAAQYRTDRPALRVVVRDVWAHPIDANEWSNRQVGQRIVHEAVRRAVHETR